MCAHKSLQRCRLVRAHLEKQRVVFDGGIQATESFHIQKHTQFDDQKDLIDRFLHLVFYEFHTKIMIARTI